MFEDLDDPIEYEEVIDEDLTVEEPSALINSDSNLPSCSQHRGDKRKRLVVQARDFDRSVFTLHNFNIMFQRALKDDKAVLNSKLWKEKSLRKHLRNVFIYDLWTVSCGDQISSLHDLKKCQSSRSKIEALNEELMTGIETYCGLTLTFLNNCHRKTVKDVLKPSDLPPLAKYFAEKYPEHEMATYSDTMSGSHYTHCDSCGDPAARFIILDNADQMQNASPSRFCSVNAFCLGHFTLGSLYFTIAHILWNFQRNAEYRIYNGGKHHTGTLESARELVEAVPDSIIDCLVNEYVAWYFYLGVVKPSNPAVKRRMYSEMSLK